MLLLLLVDLQSRKEGLHDKGNIEENVDCRHGPSPVLQHDAREYVGHS